MAHKLSLIVGTCQSPPLGCRICLKHPSASYKIMELPWSLAFLNWGQGKSSTCSNTWTKANAQLQSIHGLLIKLCFDMLLQTGTTSNSLCNKSHWIIAPKDYAPEARWYNPYGPRRTSINQRHLHRPSWTGPLTPPPKHPPPLIPGNPTTTPSTKY